MSLAFFLYTLGSLFSGLGLTQLLFAFFCLSVDQLKALFIFLSETAMHHCTLHCQHKWKWKLYQWLSECFNLFQHFIYLNQIFLFFFIAPVFSWWPAVEVVLEEDTEEEEEEEEAELAKAELANCSSIIIDFSLWLATPKLFKTLPAFIRAFFPCCCCRQLP